MTPTMYHGTPHIQNCSVLLVKKIGGLYFGTRGVSFIALISHSLIASACSESRYMRQFPLKVSPTQTKCSPDGRAVRDTSSGHQMFFLTFGKHGENEKESWHFSDKDGVSICAYNTLSYA